MQTAGNYFTKHIWNAFKQLSKSLRVRIECIAAAELLLVATNNFRLEYDTHLALSDEAATRCFPALGRREQRALSRYFYYASYHSFWTHAGLFYRPAAVAAACLKLAAAEVRRLEGLELRFEATRLAPWEVDENEVDAIVEILEFGKLHIRFFRFMLLYWGEIYFIVRSLLFIVGVYDYNFDPL